MKEARASNLTAADVRAIRERYKVVQNSKGKSSNALELSKEYGISQESIRNIAKRKTFSWV